jgi:carbonic anhydrase/acetyltransferase-like protein (isoleucine patch superfamily)
MGAPAALNCVAAGQGRCGAPPWPSSAVCAAASSGYYSAMPLFHKRPDGAYQAHNATVCGDVTVGAQSSFWFNTVVRGDVAPIIIGQRVNIQDGAVIHCDHGITNVIEDDVIIGHGAIVHGALVGRGSLIGMHATVLGRTKIGVECLIAAGAGCRRDWSCPTGMWSSEFPARSSARSRKRN